MMGLLQLADDLGLVVVEKRAIAHTSGYRPGENMIRLTPGMSRRAARSVLAHELGHHVLGHRPTEYGPVYGRQERAAMDWAARYLIDADAYRTVERLREGHAGAMAHDLDVAPELLEHYRGMLHRIGDAVYTAPKMGAGQFHARAEVA